MWLMEATGAGRSIQTVSELGMACPKCGSGQWFNFSDQPLSRKDVRAAPRHHACADCGAKIHFYLVRMPTRDPGWRESRRALRYPAKATPAMAREALRLVEAIVDYLLIPPRRVDDLRHHLDGDPTDG